jgi:hypothetical protein
MGSLRFRFLISLHRPIAIISQSSIPSFHQVYPSSASNPYSTASRSKNKNKMAPKKASAASEKKVLLGRPSNNLKIGIVGLSVFIFPLQKTILLLFFICSGLPNVGKSSFFNVLSDTGAFHQPIHYTTNNFLFFFFKKKKQRSRKSRQLPLRNHKPRRSTYPRSRLPIRLALRDLQTHLTYTGFPNLHRHRRSNRRTCPNLYPFFYFSLIKHTHTTGCINRCRPWQLFPLTRPRRRWNLPSRPRFRRCRSHTCRRRCRSFTRYGNHSDRA